MDMDLQQNCNDEVNDNKCTKWKSLERTVVETSVTIVTISVPLVPIINFALSETAGTTMAKMYNTLSGVLYKKRRNART
jgi:hypothetical protein